VAIMVGRAPSPADQGGEGSCGDKALNTLRAMRKAAVNNEKDGVTPACPQALEKGYDGAPP
jgi:hypothetical protein